jgi:hypothetical protein
MHVTTTLGSALYLAFCEISQDSLSGKWPGADGS